MNALSSSTARAAGCGFRRKPRTPSCSTRPRANRWPCLGRSIFAPGNWSPCSAPSLMHRPSRSLCACCSAIADAAFRPYWYLTMPLTTMLPNQAFSLQHGIAHFGWISFHRIAPNSIPSNAFGNCCAASLHITSISPRSMLSSPPLKDRSINSRNPTKSSETYAADIKSLCIACFSGLLFPPSFRGLPKTGFPIGYCSPRQVAARSRTG